MVFCIRFVETRLIFQSLNPKSPEPKALFFVQQTIWYGRLRSYATGLWLSKVTSNHHSRSLYRVAGTAVTQTVLRGTFYRVACKRVGTCRTRLWNRIEWGENSHMLNQTCHLLKKKKTAYLITALNLVFHTSTKAIQDVVSAVLPPLPAWSKIQDITISLPTISLPQKSAPPPLIMTSSLSYFSLLPGPMFLSCSPPPTPFSFLYSKDCNKVTALFLLCTLPYCTKARLHSRRNIVCFS